MKFTVPGSPKVLQRARMGRYGKWYDPSANEKKYIAGFALQAMATARTDQISGNLMACMTFYISDRRRKDLDNLIKSVMDALNKLVYDDDSQIVRIIASKEVCEKNKDRTEVEIFPIKA